ncbi:MAG: hypothetical protein Q7S02_01025 [bacterium]|nr:hypothetical protein [bacterium]
MKRSLNHYLNLLTEYDPLTEEQHAAIGARVRRDIIARYGRFAVPTRSAVHTPEAVRGGMLIYLHALRSLGGVGRPALAFAVIGVLIVGAVAVMRRIGGTAPSLPPSAVVMSTAPVEPGSGIAVSVFGVVAPATGATTSPSAPVPAARRVYRPARPLTPADGVFTQWNRANVFSEEEALKVPRDGKTILSS